MHIKTTTIYFCRLTAAAFLSFSYVYTITEALRISYSPFNIFIIIFALLVLYSLIFYNKISIKVSGFTMAVTLVLGTLYLLSYNSLSKLINDFITFLNPIFSYFNYQTSLNLHYSLYLVILLCIAFSLFVFIFAIKNLNFIVLFLGGAVIFAAQWILDYYYSYTSFCIFIVIIILYYFKHIYMKRYVKDPHNYIKPEFFCLYIIPVCILVLIISIAIPADNNRLMKWQWLDNKIVKISDYFVNLSNNSTVSQTFNIFSISSTGFGNNADILGGHVTLDDTLTLEVDSPKSNLYLKGGSKNFYTGISWIGDDHKNSVSTRYSDDDYTLNTNVFQNKAALYDCFDFDTFETLIGSNLLTDNDNLFNQCFYETMIYIEYKDLKTNSVFIPLKTKSFYPFTVPVSNFSFNSNGFLFNSNGILYCEKNLEKGFNYSVSFYHTDYRKDSFINAARKSKKGLYGEYLSTHYNLNDNSFVNYTDIKLLNDNAKRIYSIYLQLPDNLPERIGSLASSITSKHSNNFDKVKAIERYLSKNYTYTLTPDETPQGIDFVNYFLFDLKEGYCTYYATAMTILVRCLGIPARYVEGYILPSSPDSSTIYRVTNRQAHAWVEVYFEGLGWISFEPTSSFSMDIPSSVDQEYNSRNDMYNLENRTDMEQDDSKDPFDSNEEGIEVSGDNISLKDGIEKKGLFIFLLIISILICLVFYMLFNLLRQKRRLYIICKQPPKESILSTYKIFIGILSLQGHKMQDGETPLQFAERIDKYFIFIPMSFTHITKIFLNARYSNNKITVNEKQTVLDFYPIFMNEAKKNMHKCKHFIYRYFMGRL